jgi:hypothetical protein
VLEWRQDVRRELWGAAALDQLDQGVQVNRALTRELVRQLAVEAGVAQSCASPGHDVGCFSADAALLSGSKVHLFLAHRGDQFLLPAASASCLTNGAWGQALVEVHPSCSGKRPAAVAMSQVTS